MDFVLVWPNLHTFSGTLQKAFNVYLVQYIQMVWNGKNLSKRHDCFKRETTGDDGSSAKYIQRPVMSWMISCAFKCPLEYKIKMQSYIGTSAKWENEKHHKFYSIFITQRIASCKNNSFFFLCFYFGVGRKKDASIATKIQQNKWNRSGYIQWDAFLMWCNR